MTRKLSDAFFGDKKFTEVLPANPENIPTSLQAKRTIRSRRHSPYLLTLHLQNIRYSKSRWYPFTLLNFLVVYARCLRGVQGMVILEVQFCSRDICTCV